MLNTLEMNTTKAFFLSVLTVCLIIAVGGCTSMAVDPTAVANIKSVTVVQLQVPEYNYAGGGVEGAAKSMGIAAAAYGFGGLGIVASGIAISKLEQPHREAIRDALAPYRPSFATAFNQELEATLTKRGIATIWIPPPAMLADNSAYDLSAANIDTDYVIELFPSFVGFVYDGSASRPNINVRWRLIKRYPGGKFIETNRGYIIYQSTASETTSLPSIAQVPHVSEYLYAGHVNKLADYGEAPPAALRDIARKAAQLTAQRTLPAAAQ